MSRLTSHTPPRRRWRDVAAVHRLEYPFAACYVCYAVWGAGFAEPGAGGQATGPAVLAAVTAFLLIVAGLALNTAVDIRTDERHAERQELAGAANRLGGRVPALRWAVGEMAVALAAAAAVWVWAGHWAPACVAAGIVVLHVLYNVEPVHLKRRGLAGPPVFCAAVIVLPCLLVHTAVTPVVEPSAWLVYGGLGVLAAGRLLWWSVPDIEADAETGMATAPVRYGAVRAVLLGTVVMVAGLGLLTWGLWWWTGAVAAVVGTAAHWVFVGVAATMLGVLARGAVPDPRRMRTRSMSVMLVGDLALTVVALTGG